MIDLNCKTSKGAQTECMFKLQIQEYFTNVHVVLYIVLLPQVPLHLDDLPLFSLHLIVFHSFPRQLQFGLVNNWFGHQDINPGAWQIHPVKHWRIEVVNHEEDEIRPRSRFPCPFLERFGMKIVFRKISTMPSMSFANIRREMKSQSVAEAKGISNAVHRSAPKCLNRVVRTFLQPNGIRQTSVEQLQLFEIPQIERKPRGTLVESRQSRLAHCQFDYVHIVYVLFLFSLSGPRLTHPAGWI